MADIRIKDLPTTATQTASDDFIALDGTVNGTRKIDASAPSFKTSVTSPSVVAPASTALTLTGGSTGASLVLGQGATAADVTITPKGTGIAVISGPLVVGASSSVVQTAWTGAGYAGRIMFPDSSNFSLFSEPNALYRGGGMLTNIARVGGSWGFVDSTKPAWRVYFGNGALSDNFSISRSASTTYSESSLLQLTGTGNLLIGTTTDMSGSGGLKIAGTTAATTTTSGALIVAGGAGFAKAIYVNQNAFIDGAAGTFRSLQYTASNVNRWGIGATNTAETGGNSGSDFIFNRWSDAGADLGSVLTLTRSTGAAAFSGAVTTQTGGFRSSGSLTLGTSFPSIGAGFQIDYTAPVTTQFFGDGTGYSMVWASRSASTTTARMTLTDAGALMVTGTATAARFISPTGGSSSGVISITGANANIEMGAVGSANTPFIDFHSSASSTDYDARIQASGGTASAGAGTLSLTAAMINIPGTAPSTGSTSGALQVAGGIYAGAASVFGGTVTVGTGAGAADASITVNGTQTTQSSNIKFQAGGVGKWIMGRGVATGNNNWILFNENLAAAAVTVDTATSSATFAGAVSITSASGITSAGNLTLTTATDSRINFIAGQTAWLNYNLAADRWTFRHTTSGVTSLTLTEAAATFAGAVTAASTVQVGTILRIGGETASFPGLRNTGARLDVVTANNAVWANIAAAQFEQSDNGISWSSGVGSPEGVKTAPTGSLYSRTDGGASTTLYVKQSGAGNTGWVAK